MMAVFGAASSPRRKEGDTRWAQEYLLDPLNAVEAYQTAQTGGQYNDQVPTQHKTVPAAEYHAGLGRSRSFLRGSSKSKDGGEAQDGTSQIRRTASIKDKLMRRFTDDGKNPDRRQRPSRPLIEVSNKEISRLGNVAPPRGPRQLTPALASPKVQDTPSQQDKNDLQNQENRPVVKRPEVRYSNNPYREALLEAEDRENRSPPSSPIQTSPTNPFRRTMEEPYRPSYSSPRAHPQTTQAHRNTQRSDGPRVPSKHRSRGEHKPRPLVQRTPVADTIDQLDTSFGMFTFHHDGPYEATLSHRNRNPLKSPVRATRYGNELALRATAPQDIENSLQFGRPLDGVAAFPPGTQLSNGDTLQYEEYDVHRKDGNFRRYPGFVYRDEDLKGKGIEGFDGDLEAKKKKEAKHQRGKSLDSRTQKPGDTAGVNNSIRRNGSTAGRLEGAAAKIKRTFSLKRREK
ncbi:hypothetical protein DRE_06072 [Drechslerella stenobrocha 248]|uniref:Pal1 cell morphology protein n=1 Tax=Drechslerella stenobrocha 248 TaxID=1043628 RepID=W7HPW4_9PEZI|nr:hypothetical protein DRE_06072 [Drechslerella stenobrocha 248]